MPAFKLFLREIRVVPVIIEADTVEQAQEDVREGFGEYLNDQSFHSDLDAGEHFDSLFEKPAEQIQLADSYEDGECPDCGEAIPKDAPEGHTCANCKRALFFITTSQEQQRRDEKHGLYGGDVDIAN